MLRKRLARPLPGGAAQARLAPRPRVGWEPGRVPAGCRTAAGLLLVYPRQDVPHVLLTLRNRRLPQHGGQVSLPGGVVDRGEGIEAAAVREAREETGIPPDTVRLLGRLSPLHIPVSRFVLHPVVAVADARPAFRPSEDEVARILEVPVAALRDPGRRSQERIERDGVEFTVPYIGLEGEKVWGATAMILAEFVALLEDPQGSP